MTGEKNVDFPLRSLISLRKLGEKTWQLCFVWLVCIGFFSPSQDAKNRGKLKDSVGIPNPKCVVILVVTGILGGGHTATPQGMHGISWSGFRKNPEIWLRYHFLT